MCKSKMTNKFKAVSFLPSFFFLLLLFFFLLFFISVRFFFFDYFFVCPPFFFFVFTLFFFFLKDKFACFFKSIYVYIFNCSLQPIHLCRTCTHAHTNTHTLNTTGPKWQICLIMHHLEHSFLSSCLSFFLSFCYQLSLSLLHTYTNHSLWLYFTAVLCYSLILKGTAAMCTVAGPIKKL